MTSDEENGRDPFSILSEELKKEEEAHKNIKNEKVFDLNYIPEKIYPRKEMKTIAGNIAQYINKGIPINMVVYGNKGTGKTLSVLSLLNAGKKLGKLDYAYIKATESPTSFKMFETIVGRSMHGYSFNEAKEEALKKITERYVIVIDEANAMKDDTILYILSRDTKAMIILLTQKTLWFNSLKDGIKSSLLPKHIYLQPYDVVELKSILRMRAEEGLNTFSEDGISIMSSLLYREYSSDTRVGIRALYYAGMNNDWSEENIKASLAEANKELNYYILEKLEDNEILVLYALLQDNSTNKAYAILEDYMKKIFGGSIIKKSQYFNIIHNLSNLGLIDTIKKQEDKYYTLEIQFLIDPKLVTEEFKKRFESEGG